VREVARRLYDEVPKKAEARTCLDEEPQGTSSREFYRQLLEALARSNET